MFALNNSVYLYPDDVSMDMVGAPGSFTNSLAVASVNNDGTSGAYITVGDALIIYNETKYTNRPLTAKASRDPSGVSAFGLCRVQHSL